MLPENLQKKIKKNGNENGADKVDNVKEEIKEEQVKEVKIKNGKVSEVKKNANPVSVETIEWQDKDEEKTKTY